MWASCILRHCSNASANSGRCRRGFWCPSALKRRIQCLAFWNRSARAAAKSCLSRAMRSKSMTSFSPMVCFANESRYPSCSYHVESIVGWLPCFSRLAFLSISFALKNIICLSETPCFGPRLEFFSMTKPGIEVKSQLVFWSVVRLRENCNKWSRFRKRHCNQDIDVLQNSRKVRRSLCGSCRRVIVVTPRWTCWSPAFDSCL